MLRLLLSAIILTACADSNKDNTGEEILTYFTSILYNDTYTNYINTMMNQTIVCDYDVDRNLDGKYDEKDRALTQALSPIRPYTASTIPSPSTTWNPLAG